MDKKRSRSATLQWGDPEQAPEHAVIFLVTRKDSEEHAALCDGVTAAASMRSSAGLRSAARRVMKVARPDLAGATVWYVGFNYDSLVLEIGVAHPSLPPVAVAAEVPHRYLFESERSSEPRHGDWKQYARRSVAEMRPYRPGEMLAGVSISEADKRANSPALGDMVARNPQNHADQWLVSKKYFHENFDPTPIGSATDGE